MNPSSEVGKASGEATGIGETMEDVVTAVDAMASVADAVEAMVTAVEMREWLEVGRPERERTTAVHFFSRALAVQKQKVVEYFFSVHRYSRPLYWPGLLPGLVELLADCLLPCNSKAIQSEAMLSIKYLFLAHTSRNADYEHLLQFLREVNSHASDPLLRLVRETDCTEIRDQAVWLLGRIACPPYGNVNQIDTMWVKGFFPLLIDLVRNYAAISEPTDTEISSLNTAIKALTQVHKMLEDSNPFHPQPFWEPHILEILPVLIGIFQEPGKRKKAQVRAGEFLGYMARFLEGDFFLENGTIQMLLETVRVGKEPTAVLVKALQALRIFIGHNNEGVYNGVVHVKNMLDMGALDVFHLVLKRPNDRFKNHTLWDSVMECLFSTVEFATAGNHLEAVLSQEGLMELALDLALGMDMSEETACYHYRTKFLLLGLTRQCSESQMRRLMLKDPLFHLLSRYLNGEHSCSVVLGTVENCLAKCSAAHQRILRRLLDDTGITDAVRRISRLNDDFGNHDRARNILDTYLNNPLPPRTPHNLPFIIYTRNAPY